MSGIVVNALVSVAYGLSANLPTTAAEIAAALNVSVSSVTPGVLFFCTDTGVLFVWNGSQMIQAGGNNTVWGDITGTLGNQTDLESALSAVQSTTESFAVAAVASETSRAETAEALLVPQTTTVNSHALSSNVTISASDLTTGTLPHAQLPSLVSGDIPNNSANTTGTAAGLSSTPSIAITNLTVNGTTSFVAGSIAIAALAQDAISLTDSTGLFTVSGSPASLGGGLTLSAFATQTANTILRTGSGTPSFSAMVVGDMPTSGTWAFAGTLSGAMTMTGNTLQTSTDTLGLASYTAGVSNSPSMVIAGSYESAATPTYAEDSWTLQNVIGTGVNGTSTLTITHSGTTGTVQIKAPAVAGVYSWAGGTGGIGPSTAGANLVGLYSGGAEIQRVTGSGIGIGGSISLGVATTSLDTGINRLAATSMAIGNAVSGDWAGSLKASGLIGSSLSLAPLSNVGTVTVTPTGGSASTWTYVVVAKDANGNVCAASSAFSTTVGAATLTGAAFNTLTWTAIPGANSYDVYRTVHATSPTTLGKIGNVLSSVNVATTGFKDTGLAGDSTTAPSVNLTGSIQLSASAAAPTSAGTPGTAGQIIYNGVLLYFCSVSGAAGSATWNKLNMTAV